MTSYVNVELRRQVFARADYMCEYCLLHEDDTGYGCEVDHIISEKHGGQTVSNNLAVACWPCNNSKGTDIASIKPGTGELVRFFNPRTDAWHEHFRLRGAEIESLTAIGEATARIFGFNLRDRIKERQELIDTNAYPHPAARTRLSP
jgi:hypothetical protein